MNLPTIGADYFIPVLGGSVRLGIADISSVPKKVEMYDDLKDFVTQGSLLSESSVDDFLIGRFPVLQIEFIPWILNNQNRVLTAKRRKHWREFAESPLYEPDAPVYGVSLLEANEYANTMGARLPTKEEWVRAARGDDQLDTPQDLEKVYWRDDVGWKAYDLPWVISCHRADPWTSWVGAVDMMGNVSELTSSVSLCKSASSRDAVMESGFLSPVLAYGFSHSIQIPHPQSTARFRSVAPHHGFRLARSHMVGEPTQDCPKKHQTS